MIQSYFDLLQTVLNFHSSVLPAVRIANFKGFVSRHPVRKDRPLDVPSYGPSSGSNSDLKQATFLTTGTLTGSKLDVFDQSQHLLQSRWRSRCQKSLAQRR